jgi:hypothetical protein
MLFLDHDIKPEILVAGEIDHPLGGGIDRIAGWWFVVG